MSTITYTVKVASAKFTIDDAVAPKLTFRDGDTYIFDQADSTNSGHILQFSITSNNSGSAEYTVGVTKAGTPGSAGASTTIITSSSTTDTIYYYSSGGGTYGEEFSNSGFNTSTTYNLLKPIIGGSNTAEKWGSMVNHAIDQIDQSIPAEVAFGFQSTPHIIPAKLYPSSGNDLAGAVLVATTTGPNSSTVASSKYGTVQASDGRMYYYTDIKGSKPIKDPRIGAYFGSQRHMFQSFQTLEQETATQGSNVFSIDGREWIRRVGNNWTNYNNANGVWFSCSNSAATNTNWIEITGYFNAVNWLALAPDSVNDTNISIDGTANSSTFTGATGSIASPIANSRFINACSVIALTFDSTPSLGIHTIKLSNENGDYMRTYGIELIAQDTTSTATKSQIQIPSQNVVSYGKKFTVAETKHYNPFAFKTDGSTAWASGAHNGTAWPIGTGSSTNIDTATSLGLAAWVSTNYYYPYNGGRVVKWVASDGTIKTSVNMMPPNARSYLTTAISAKANAAAANDTYLPTFEAGTIDHSQAEVAKTFHFREFGNGAANAGTLSGTFPDASMLNTADDIAYVMDDGLTSLSGDDVLFSGGTDYLHASGGSSFITFIGTGFTTTPSEYTPGTYHIAQNLPYGTHIVKMQRSGAYTVDGIATGANAGTYGAFNEISIHQPKMPPIPEDACIIADYMLMADYVKQTATSADIEGQISKGVRLIQSARDIFYNSSGAFSALSGTVKPSHPLGLRIHNANASSTGKLPFFGTAVTFWGESVELAGWSATLGGSTVTETHLDNTGGLGGHGDAMTIADGDAVTLGMTNTVVTFPTAYNFYGLGVATPIHTSSHYQTFETPFLHELVGGDRNMEQTNLVVTPDGKTWDQVTRDVSYIGNECINSKPDTDLGSSLAFFIYTEHRGTATGAENLFNKDWAIAYDRFICLKNGHYTIHAQISTTSGGQEGYIEVRKNDTFFLGGEANPEAGYRGNIGVSMSLFFKRGDYLQVKGVYAEGGSTAFHNLSVTRT